VKMMKECIDKMLVILPFEKDYFRDKWDWEVEYVGHPLLEAVGSHKSVVGSQQPGIVALLPGSRKQEILKKLPVMLEVSKYFPDHQFIVAGAPGMDPGFYAPLMAPYPNVSLLQNQTYDLLSKADAALVTSGTATLETALFGVPEVVCYKASWLSYQIGKRVVDIKYICLVNLIMDKLVVKEMIQDDMSTENLRKELDLLLNDETYRNRIKADYAALRALLHQGGDASEKAALSIVKFLAQ
jgi:lipid-A-disaccharide synthase